LISLTLLLVTELFWLAAFLFTLRGWAPSPPAEASLIWALCSGTLDRDLNCLTWTWFFFSSLLPVCPTTLKVFRLWELWVAEGTRPNFAVAPVVSVFCLAAAVPLLAWFWTYCKDRRPTALPGTTWWVLALAKKSFPLINLLCPAALVEATPRWAPARKLSLLPTCVMRLLAGAAAVFSLSVISGMLSWVLDCVSSLLCWFWFVF